MNSGGRGEDSEEEPATLWDCFQKNVDAPMKCGGDETADLFSVEREMSKRHRDFFAQEL